MGQVAKIVIFLLALKYSYSLDAPVYVNTSRGPVVGFHRDNGNNKSAMYYGQGDVFLGIPYVKPPVGELTFQRPQRLDKWNGTQNATYWRPMCPQHGKKESNPDCLYLNIFTPNASSTYKYSVLLWIHGGGLDIGDGNFGIDGPIRNLISRGIVLVTIQYRLNVMGFFTTLSDYFPANNGMLDQMEAIRWVKEEIENFGGDPYRLTIGGVSGGAASVSAHTYSPLSQGLFTQAIEESGAIWTNLQGALGMSYLSYDVANRFCNYTANEWNSGNYTALKQCLTGYDPVELSKIDSGAEGWKIVQDNYFLPDVPRNLWQKRPNIPRMMGTSKDEWAYYEIGYMNDGTTNFTDYTRQHFVGELAQFAGKIFGNQLTTATDIFAKMFVPDGTTDDDHFAWLKATIDVFSAAGFSSGISKDIEFYLRNNNTQVYVYEFTYAGNLTNKCHSVQCQIPGWNPVVHASEEKYIFMDESTWTNINQTLITPEDYKIADFFGEVWTNFVKYGKPFLNDTWAPTTQIDVTKTEYFEIGKNMGMRTGYRTNERIAWNSIVPALVGDLPQEMHDYNNGSCYPNGNPTSNPISLSTPGPKGQSTLSTNTKDIPSTSKDPSPGPSSTFSNKNNDKTGGLAINIRSSLTTIFACSILSMIYARLKMI